jgi:hypothetical protein
LQPQTLIVYAGWDKKFKKRLPQFPIKSIEKQRRVERGQGSKVQGFKGSRAEGFNVNVFPMNFLTLEPLNP